MPIMKLRYLLLLLILVPVFLLDNCGGCWNDLEEDPKSEFNLTLIPEETATFIEDKKKIKLVLHIEPKNIVSEIISHYDLMSWESLGNLKGELVGIDGKLIKDVIKLYNGDNIFFYTPNEEGDHAIKFFLRDVYEEVTKDVTSNIIKVTKKPLPTFNPELKSTSKVIFSHQSVPLELDITTDEEAAKKLPYTIKKITTRDGSLYAENGKELKPGSALVLGKQIILFKPISEKVGNTKVKVLVTNGQVEAQASLAVELKPLVFNVSLSKVTQVYSYQTANIDLNLTSKYEGAKKLAYFVKELEVTKGELVAEDGEKKIEVGSPIAYGMQNIQFKPTGEAGIAKIDITIQNKETGSESKRSMTIPVKPVTFKTKINLRNATQEENKLIPGDIAVLEIMLFDIDKDLKAENWNISEYRFSDSIKRNVTDKDLKQGNAFPLEVKVGNKFYIELPNIQLDQNPSFIFTIEGPGGTKQEHTEYLAPVQRKIIHNQQQQFLQSVEEQADVLNKTLKSPTKGSNYGLIKRASRASMRRIADLQEGLVNLRNRFGGSDEGKLSKIVKDLEDLEKKQEKLDTLKQSCKNKQSCFQATLSAESSSIFSHKEAKLTLDLSSDEETAKELMYTIKHLEVEGGKLLLERTREELKEGNKLTFGKQHLILQPDINAENITVSLNASNNKNGEANASVVVEVKPIKFQADAWLKESDPKDPKRIKGDHAILEVMISDMDDELAKEPWRLVAWSFGKDIVPAVISNIEASEEFREFETALENLNLTLVEGGSEKKLKDTIEQLRSIKEFEEKKIEDEKEYKEELGKKLKANQKYLTDVDGELKKITTSYNPTMPLVRLNQSRVKEYRYKEGKEKLELEAKYLGREIELQGKRLVRDDQQKAIVVKKLDEKIVKLQMALEVKRKLKASQNLTVASFVQPTLVDSNLGAMEVYPLKPKEPNKFYLNLFNLSAAPTMTLVIEGPGNTHKNIEVKLDTVLRAVAKKKMARSLESSRKLSKEMDDHLKLPVIGSNYQKLKDFNRSVGPRMQAFFKEIEESYGKEWWKNPMILSLRDLDRIVDEIVELERKKEKLDIRKKESKKKKFDFQVRATLRQPSQNSLMLMSYAELDITLLNVDASLLGETWKLLGWKYSDAQARGIVNKDLHELAEFPLQSKGENKLYLKLPVTEVEANPTMTLEIGIAGTKIVQQVTLELGPIQHAVFGKEMARFLEGLERLNKEAESYLNLPIKDKKYELLKELIQKVQIELDFYTTDERYTKLLSSYEKNASNLFRTIPREAGVTLEKIINTAIPALKSKQLKLDEEYVLWDSAITAFAPLNVTEEIVKGEEKEIIKESKEEMIAHIYNPDEEGELLIHRWANSTANIDFKAIDFILSKTLDIDAKNKKGFSPLHIVVQKENLEKVQLLLKNGANPNIKSESGYYPLFYIIDGGNEQIINALLEKGADPNLYYPGVDEYKTPLMEVILTDKLSEKQKDDRVGLLLKYKANPDISMLKGGYSKKYKDYEGWTPLYAALERGYVEICGMLLEAITRTGNQPFLPTIQDHDLRLRIYPYFRGGELYSQPGGDRSLRDRMYNVLDKYGVISYGKKYAQTSIIL